MTAAKDTTATAYGLMDSAALEELRNTFDTSRLLGMVDELAAATPSAGSGESMREMLLRLHAMAHTVVNGAGITVATDGETLPELAETIVDDMRETITRLRKWIVQLEPLVNLEPRH